MRCLTCGEEMVLAEAMRPEGAVQGFENQTHHCPACGATERRFMFVGGKTTFVAGRAERATLAPEPPRAQEVRAPNGSNTSGQAWVRAIEKFRSYEADLHRRAENTEKTNGNIEDSKASDRLTIPRLDETRAANKAQKTPVGERLRIRAFRNGRYSPPLGHSNESQPDPEAVRRFDEFWDSLVPASYGQKLELSVPAASLTPLPRSQSLVMIKPRNIPRSRVGGKYVFKKTLEKVLQWRRGAAGRRGSLREVRGGTIENSNPRPNGHRLT